MLKTFHVTVIRQIDEDQLGWPEPGEAQGDGLGCNRAYVDLRNYSWHEANKVLLAEEYILHQLLMSDDPVALYEELVDEESEDTFPPTDVGVMASVVALSAARCIPFSSCNGGCFGDSHLEDHPLIAFYMKRAWTPILLATAEEVHVGLVNGAYGTAVLYSDDIRKMLSFARALIAKKASINKLKGRAIRSIQQSATHQNTQPSLALFPASEPTE